VRRVQRQSRLKAVSSEETANSQERFPAGPRAHRCNTSRKWAQSLAYRYQTAPLYNRAAGLIFRAMNVQELGEEYRNKTDKELLRLALTPEELTPEANAALKSELAR
jgi:hypothetical protein